MNKGLEIEHGRNHLIINQWWEYLIDERGTVNGFNGPQGTLVHSMECE